MTWWREMLDLFRQYRQATRDYRWAMKQLKREIKERAHSRI